jgi:hypothetical protein
MGVWGFETKHSDAGCAGAYCAWMFITEEGKQYKSAVRESGCAAHALKNRCTFYGEGARHVQLGRMHVNKWQYHSLPVIKSWSRRWDVAKQADVWTFVAEHGEEFTAELMQCNCENLTGADAPPQVWEHTWSEASAA